MKIVFLCSCLEPGRDGVGDYTRRLAVELVIQGHLATAISLNDNFVSQQVNDIQQSEGNDLPVLRLPASWAMKVKLTHAKRYIDDFNPDWVSLQFVSFGFHPKGLPFRLGSQLSILSAGRKLHLMIHELWVGMEVEAPLKYKWWGRAQRLLIKSTVSNLKASVIHTNTSVYNLQLAKLGIQSSHLPLFPNIPVMDIAGARSTGDAADKNGIIKLLIFGAIHLDAPIRALANEAAYYEKKNNVKFILTFLGRSNKSELTRWANIWQAHGMAVEILGEQPVEFIAEIFAKTEFGITATALAMTEKSGSVALMRAYGLKVLCVSRPWTPRGVKDFKLPEDIIEYSEGCFEDFINLKVKGGVVYNVSEISAKLSKDLTEA